MNKKHNFNKLLCGGALALCFLQPVAHATGSGTEGGEWYLAIENDRPALIQTELAQGADPNARDADGNPSLMLAIRAQSWDVYEALLKHRRIDVNLENSKHETPMMYLALLGQTERLKQLQKRGGKVNRLGWTPLHYAASKGQTDTVRYLLGQKVLVNAPAPDGTSPLMMAALSGRREAVDLLLKAGADPAMQNSSGLKASDWARSAGHEDLAVYLEGLGPRRGAGAKPPAGQAPAETFPVDRSAQPVDPNHVQTLDVPPAPSQWYETSPEPKAPSPSQGGSRYFDLDRFENTDTQP